MTLASAPAAAQQQTNAAPVDGPTRTFTGADLFGLSIAADPQISPDGRTIVYVRRTGDIMSDRMQSSLWLIDVASGKAAKLLGKADTVYAATDATADGKWIAVSTDEGSGQIHGGLLEAATGKWRWLKSTPWEQVPASFTRQASAFSQTSRPYQFTVVCAGPAL